MDTPGLIFLCRDSALHPGRGRVRPADLEPLRRAGRLRDLRRRRGRQGPGVHQRRRRCLQLGHAHLLVAEHHAADHHPGAVRSWSSPTGSRSRMAEAIGDRQRRSPPTCWASCSCYVELTRTRPGARRVAGRDYGDGACLPRRCAAAPDAGDADAVVPAGERDHHPDRQPQPAGAPEPGDARRRAAPPADRPLPHAANGVDAEDRAALFRLAWDFVGSALGGRNDLYERFYLGSNWRNRKLMVMSATGQPAGNEPSELHQTAYRLVDQMLASAR